MDKQKLIITDQKEEYKSDLPTMYLRFEDTPIGEPLRVIPGTTKGTTPTTAFWSGHAHYIETAEGERAFELQFDHVPSLYHNVPDDNPRNVGYPPKLDMAFRYGRQTFPNREKK
jgi:hypothetical protein